VSIDFFAECRGGERLGLVGAERRSSKGFESGFGIESSGSEGRGSIVGEKARDCR
jgi:hypothetical protein